MKLQRLASHRQKLRANQARCSSVGQHRRASVALPLLALIRAMYALPLLALERVPIRRAANAREVACATSPQQREALLLIKPTDRKPRNLDRKSTRLNSSHEWISR